MIDRGIMAVIVYIISLAVLTCIYLFIVGKSIDSINGDPRKRNIIVSYAKVLGPVLVIILSSLIIYLIFK